jgi:hypothetical protein
MANIPSVNPSRRDIFNKCIEFIIFPVRFFLLFLSLSPYRFAKVSPLLLQAFCRRRGIGGGGYIILDIYS